MYQLPADDLNDSVDYRDGETVWVKACWATNPKVDYIMLELHKDELEALLQGFEDNKPELEKMTYDELWEAYRTLAMSTVGLGPDIFKEQSKELEDEIVRRIVEARPK